MFPGNDPKYASNPRASKVRTESLKVRNAMLYFLSAACPTVECVTFFLREVLHSFESHFSCPCLLQYVSLLIWFCFLRYVRVVSPP